MFNSQFCYEEIRKIKKTVFMFTHALPFIVLCISSCTSKFWSEITVIHKEPPLAFQTVQVYWKQISLTSVSLKYLLFFHILKDTLNGVKYKIDSFIFLEL